MKNIDNWKHKESMQEGKQGS